MRRIAAPRTATTTTRTTATITLAFASTAQGIDGTRFHHGERAVLFPVHFPVACIPFMGSNRTDCFRNGRTGIFVSKVLEPSSSGGFTESPGIKCNKDKGVTFLIRRILYKFSFWPLYTNFNPCNNYPDTKGGR